MKDLQKAGISVPFVAQHQGDNPDIEKIFKVIDVYHEFYCTLGVNFTYTIAIGKQESRVTFYLQPVRKYD